MPLRVDVNELLTHPGEYVSVSIDEPCSEEMDLRCDGNVRGSLHFSSTANLLVVRGAVTACVVTECPLCLDEVRTKVEAEVDEEFTVESGAITGLADDDAGMEDPAIKALWDGETMNLTELIRQAVVLAMPGDPLCKSDCRGLCPVCGANRNETTCACEAATTSPFAALGEIYREREGPED
jgi:uncharacterized protein